MSNKVYTSTIEYNDDFGEYYVTLPDELLESLGWEEGDIVEWHMNKDGTALVERVDEFFEEKDE
jgi:bifunctional DNA-binding transcriptional regulator/antitoxin component of YhaV-PrlF toxin-antitoxin module